MPRSGASENRRRSAATNRLSTPFRISVSRRKKHEVHAARQPLPLCALLGERLPPCNGEVVESRPPIVLRGLPRRADESLPHQSVEGRVQGALVHAEQILGPVFDELCDAPPVHGP